MLHPISGSVHPRFEPVRRAFCDNFQLHGERGASICVWYRGERVVDLWGGFVGRESGSQAWEANSLTNLFSVTKGIVATSYLMLLDRGEIDVDHPVSHYWPEFAEGPRDEPFRAERRLLTIRTLLEHRSGLLGFASPLSLETLADPEALLERLENEPLRWAPGSRQGYHGVTFGLYAGALFHKITGRSIGQFIREEIAGPLKADLYLGLTPDEEARLATRLCPIFTSSAGDLLWGMLPHLLGRSTREGRFFRQVLRPSSDTAYAFAEPAELGARGLRRFNDPAVRRLELPWANAQGSARGIAEMYRALLAGELVRSETLALLSPRGTWAETDAVIRKPMGFTLGFVKEQPHLFSPSLESFGHPGAGGALGWADPHHDLAFGYVMNQMGYHVRSPRAIALSHAIYQSLA